MSFDLRKLLDPAMGNIRAMLTSPGVLALNQDALGYAGRKLPRRQSVDNNAQMSDTAMRVEACNDSPDQAFVFNSSSGTLVQTSSGLAVTVQSEAPSVFLSFSHRWSKAVGVATVSTSDGRRILTGRSHRRLPSRRALTSTATSTRSRPTFASRTPLGPRVHPNLKRGRLPRFLARRQ
jgi:hypothetical protein